MPQPIRRPPSFFMTLVVRKDPTFHTLASLPEPCADAKRRWGS